MSEPTLRALLAAVPPLECCDPAASCFVADWLDDLDTLAERCKTGDERDRAYGRRLSRLIAEARRLREKVYAYEDALRPARAATSEGT